MEPVDVYLTYCSIKTHFSRKNYDYHKFNGKTTAKKASFYKRKDRIFFAKIARKYKTKAEIENYIVSNFIRTDILVSLRMMYIWHGKREQKH